MVMLVKEIDDYEKYMKDKNWVAELKRDGLRMITHFKNGKFEFYNRKDDVLTKDIPQDIIDDLNNIFTDNYVKDCILDGELVYVDSKGKDHRTQAQCKDAEPVYFIWDVLELNNEDLRHLTWKERKTEIRDICSLYSWTYEADSSVRYLPHYLDKRGLLKLAKENDMEGIVLKNVNGKYVEGKSKDVIKVKFTNTDEYIVIGYVNANEYSKNVKGETIKNKRFPYFGALMLAKYNKKGKLLPMGRVGGGFTDNDLITVTEKLNKDIENNNPTIFTDKDYRYPKGKINWLNKSDWFIVEIRMSGKTEYGKPFQPRFLSLRTDKKIEECIIDEM